MAFSLYMDHHVARAITDGLRARGIDTLTTEQDGAKEYPDSKLLDRAAALQRILFTRDRDFLKEVSYRQRNGINFYCVVYAHQLEVSIRECIEDLTIICAASTPQDILNQLIYLPL